MRSEEFNAGFNHLRLDPEWEKPAATDRRAGPLYHPQTYQDAVWEEQERRNAKAE